MSYTNSIKDTYQKITDEVIKHLEKGEIIWQRGWNKLGLPKNITTGKTYQGWNVFWLNFATVIKQYKTPYFLTFKQANEAGGSIKKGEKGHIIINWSQMESRTRFVKVKNDQTGEESEKPATTLVPKYFTVFNIDQTEGLSFSQVEKLFRTETEKIEACEKVIAEMPQRPEIRHGGDRAFYSPGKDIVQLPYQDQFKTDAAYYKTTFHELAHSTGHQTRLNRKELVESDGFGNELYSKEELTAEFTAAFLCAVCEIEQPLIENSTAYIQGWLKELKNDKTLLFKAAAQAQKAANFILNKEEKEREPETEPEAIAA